MYVSDFVTMPVIRDTAGKADVGLKITGPNARFSVPFNMTAIERGDHVTYVAKETGTYVIDVTYGRLAVPGTLSYGAGARFSKKYCDEFTIINLL